MEEYTHHIKHRLKRFLLFTGFKKIKHNMKVFFSSIGLCKNKYQNIKSFSATLNDVTVLFGTEDMYSNSWFFPRYAGGLLHEKKVTEMLVENLQGAQCFVDIGTNLGWYTCMGAKHMTSGTVYAFEMDDLNYELLRKNVALNKCSNVKMYNVAISDSSGLAYYKRDINYPSPGFQLVSSENDTNSTGLIPVKSVTLDSFLKKGRVEPDVIKIDVEGAELSVLMGMNLTLSVIKPVLFLEIHPENLHNFGTTTAEILSLLMENGYNVFEIEEMRNQENTMRLKTLHQKSIIKNNSMLYATTIPM